MEQYAQGSVSTYCSL